MSGKRIRAPRGTQDLFGNEMGLQQLLESTARRLFELHGYSEIRTPVFENLNLFVRSIGDTTDIVEKEMYTLSQRDESGDGGAVLALRPEGTAGVVRAYLEHELYKKKKFQKFYYMGCIFRYERPQAGRTRQFDQIGIEALGSYDPFLDAESIRLACAFFDELGLQGYEVKLNSFGCPKCRPAYRELLLKELETRKAQLCRRCRDRLQRNVFRVLDCKEETCRAATEGLPCIRDYLGEECREHFEHVCKTLDSHGLSYVLEDRLARGLDYYTKTIYEVAHPSLGARDAICGGGRYDGLAEELGGPPIGGVGFAAGVVPTLLAMRKSAKVAAEKLEAGIQVFVSAIGPEDRAACFELVNRLRDSGISAEMDYEERSVKAQMRSANKMKAKYVLIVGPEERASAKVKMKDMTSGEEVALQVDRAIEAIKHGLKAREG